ncbi:Putative transcription factor 5qNCA, contains JmjC domain [Ceraceosorus bombacis]|uniref:Putative transcription factor 5qNCA, contains JmjC domain n=1 Tax=Ceraceosorus bombacis TaxID=401625 RepID=A0A0P1BBG6_9BASI|nr:Putative transcription factor 5qNCA, contains JmjC domain [Ceraceosorus bombacis]
MNGASAATSTSESSTDISSISPVQRDAADQRLDDGSRRSSPLTAPSSATSEEDEVQLIEASSFASKAPSRRSNASKTSEGATTPSRVSPIPPKDSTRTHRDVAAPSSSGHSMPSSGFVSTFKRARLSDRTRKEAHTEAQIQRPLSASSESEMNYDDEEDEVSPRKAGRKRGVMVIDDDDDSDAKATPTLERTRHFSSEDVELVEPPSSSDQLTSAPLSTPTAGSKRKASVLARELNSKLSWNLNLPIEEAVRNDAGPSKSRTRPVKRKSNGAATSAALPSSEDRKTKSPRKSANKPAPDRSEWREMIDGNLWEHQSTSCQHRSISHFARCVACIAKLTGDGCRFRYLRCLPLDADGNLKPPLSTLKAEPSTLQGTTREGVDNEHFFASEVHPEEPAIFPDPRNGYNLRMTREIRKVTKITAAKHLLSLLEEELAHASLPGCLVRRRSLKEAISCDACNTSLFSASFFCKLCGRELCRECQARLVAEVEQGAQAVWRSNKIPAYAKCRFGANRKGSTVHHELDMMVPVTRFRRADLEGEVTAMKECLAIQSPGESNRGPGPLERVLGEGTDPDAAASYQSSVSSGPGRAPVRSLVINYMDTANLTEDSFDAAWSRGEPLVITNVITASVWSPARFAQENQGNRAYIVRCDKTDAFKQVMVSDFFNTFGKSGEQKTAALGKGIWKLKDWPDSANFADEFGQLYKEFQEAVPAPDLSRRDGRRNISAMFPSNANAPDLGPKMYCAWPGDLTTGGKGSTLLHMDMADAVNIMLYAAPSADGVPQGAAWDLFRAEDSDALRSFIRQRFPEQCTAQDPIHTQNFYLDESLLNELYDKHRVKPWRVYQRANEAVFIPAGCAHQVCNLTDCIKVAVDFISPHNVDRCFKLTQEFRGMTDGIQKSWKADVLQLRAQLWFAWAACRSYEQAEQITEAEVIMADEAAGKAAGAPDQSDGVPADGGAESQSGVDAKFLGTASSR